MKNLNSRGRGFRIFSFVLCTFIANVTTMFAQQDFICVTEEDNASENASVTYSYSTDETFLKSFEPVVFNIKFWQVNAPDGTNPSPISETMALGAVANLNIEFNKYNIFFKYYGFNEYDSPNNVVQEIYDYSISACVPVLDPNGNPVLDSDGFGILNRCQISELYAAAANDGAYAANSFNVYVPYECQQFGGGANYYHTKSVIPSGNILKKTFIHEVGHSLGLRHTHNNYDSSSCEHVTRDPTNPDYNAETRGDYVVDTNAVPSFIGEYCREYNLPSSECSSNGGQYYAYYIDPITCEYTGTGEDCLYEPYTIDFSDTKNYMSYTRNTCDGQFTTGQGIRMQETIVADSNGRYAMAETSISSLYEPYKGAYYFAGPTQDPQDRPLFQPGFEYRFIECDCDCNEPAAYEDISFSVTTNILKSVSKYESDYETIYHPNHTAIGIKVIDQPIFWPQTRKCYDNYNRASSGGKITRFNDGVFNANVSITPQDSTAINSPNLIDNLPSGLYSIDKDYDDGSTEQTVIIKENN